MPLERGSDDETVKKNIKKLISEGYEQDQAIAISLSKAGRSKDHTAQFSAFAADERKRIGDVKEFQVEEDDDGINVRNVHVFTTDSQFDKKWWDRAIETHREDEEAGNLLPGVHVGHPQRNDKGHPIEEKPNLGFLSNIRRRGEKVFADLVKLSKGAFRKIAGRELPGRSMELYEKLGRVGGMALLGSSMPAKRLTFYDASDETLTSVDINPWPAEFAASFKGKENMEDKPDKTMLDDMKGDKDGPDGAGGGEPPNGKADDENQRDPEGGAAPDAGYDPAQEAQQAESTARMAKLEEAVRAMGGDLALALQGLKEKEVNEDDDDETKTDNEDTKKMADNENYKREALTARVANFTVADPVKFVDQLMTMTDDQIAAMFSVLPPKETPKLPDRLPEGGADDPADVAKDSRAKLNAAMLAFAAKENISSEEALGRMSKLSEYKDLYQFAIDEVPSDGSTPEAMDCGHDVTPKA